MIISQHNLQTFLRMPLKWHSQRIPIHTTENRYCLTKAGSIINLLQMQQFNHQVDVIRGVREQECSGMMKEFFKDLRQGKMKKA